MLAVGMTRLRARLAAGTAILVLNASAAMAQTASIAIPEMPLSDALKMIARQTGENILFTPDSVAGLRAHAVAGSMGAFDAVAAVLQGTRLEAVSDGNGGLIVRPAAPAPHAEAPGPVSPPDVIESITVTGSRISTPGFVSPTPATVLDGKSLLMYGELGLQGVEYDIPQLAPNQSIVSQANSPGLSTFNLRNLGPTRTLVLLDGQRIMPSDSLSGVVDVNTLPAILINKVEVVTGGASAAYGSDAVSGVVNVSLDSEFNGFKATSQVGESDYGDYRNVGLSATFGRNFGAGDRGHVTASAEFYTNSGVCCQGSRPWDRQGWGLVANPASTPTNGIPKNFIGANTRLAVQADTGLITSGPLKGTTFTAAGVPIPFNYGTSVGSVFMIGGDGTNYAPQGNIFPEEARLTFYGKADFQLSAGLHVWAETLVGREADFYPVITNFDSADITVSLDNAFLPASLRSAMVANKITSFVMGRSNRDLGNPAFGGFAITAPVFNNRHVSAGADGNLSGWEWKAFVQYNSDDFLDRIENDKIISHWNNAVDSLINPATGQPVCRSTLSAPGNGCVPVNLFGLGTISQGVINYATTTMNVNETETELDGAIDVQGTPLEDWAGPVSVAGGFEWRREAANGTSNPFALANDLFTANRAIVGSYTVAEGYLETVVPLAKDLAWAKSLEFNAAARITGYSTSGIAEAWKLGANYLPVDELRIRATFSHDIRAPNLAELFQPLVYNINTVQDPFTNQQTTIRTYAGGNPLLEPEQANNITTGFVYRPDWLAGLQFSADYFRVNIHHAINGLTNQQVVDNCRAGQAAYCANITRDPVTGLITSVVANKLNFQMLETDGVDIEASYALAGSSLPVKLPGDFGVRMLGNYVEHLSTLASGVTTDYAGQVGQTTGLPHWRMNITTVWDLAPFALQAQFRYVQGGTLNATYKFGIDISAADGHVADRTYVDLAGLYQLGGGMSLFGKVGNLFNTDPPLTPTSILKPLAAASPLFDDIGRTYSLGVRVSL